MAFIYLVIYFKIESRQIVSYSFPRRMHSLFGKKSVFQAKARVFSFFCRFEAETLLLLFLDSQERYFCVAMYGGVKSAVHGV